MSNKQLKDFAAKSTPVAADIIYGGNSANSFNEVKMTVSSLLSNNIISPNNIIYVAKNGNDTTGSGTINNPYLTIASALASITDADDGNAYKIKMASGTFNENIVLKPYVYLEGEGLHATFINGNFSLDPGFLGAGGFYAGISNFRVPNGSAYFDVTSANTNNVILEIDTVSFDNFFASTFRMTGTADNTISCNLSNSSIAQAMLLTSTGSFVSKNNIYYQTIDYVKNTVNPTVSSDFSFFKDVCNAQVHILMTGDDQFLQVKAFLTDFFGNLNVESGINAQVNVDSYSIAYLSTTGNINKFLYYGAIGTRVDFTPTNYTATDATVESHLQGINTKLGFIPTIVNHQNIVYVDLAGNDTTGDGSFNKPFATLSHAQSVIGTATSSNLYAIVLGTGTFTETTVTLKPWIYIIGTSRENTHLNVTNLLLNSGVLANGSSSFATLAFNNLTIDSAISWDFTGSVGPTAPNIHFYQTTLNAISVANTTSTVISRLRMWNCRGLANVTVTGACAFQFFFTDISGNYINSNAVTGSAQTIFRNCGVSALTLSSLANVSVTGSRVTSISLDGTGAIFSADAVSYQVPTLTSGALITQGSKSTSITAIANGLSSALTSTNIYVGNGSGVATAVAMSGDATLSNAGALTIGSNKVTYAKMQTVTASRLLGNPTGSTANASEISLGSGLSFIGSTLNVTAGGIAVVNQTSSTATLSANTCYITNNGASLVTYTLPTTAAVGDVFEIVGNSSGKWTLAQNAGQSILVDSTNTTTGTGGSITATTNGGSIRFRCTVANTNFTAQTVLASLTIV